MKVRGSGAAVVALVAADALEDAETVVQRVREDVDARVLEGHELSIDPDLVDGIELRRAGSHDQ